MKSIPALSPLPLKAVKAIITIGAPMSSFNLVLADCFQFVNDVARADFLLLVSTEDIPHLQQEHIDRIV
jgi:hypothetical protein